MLVLILRPLEAGHRSSQFVLQDSSKECRSRSVEKRTWCCDVLLPESESARDGASESRLGPMLSCDGLLRIDTGTCGERDPDPDPDPDDSLSSPTEGRAPCEVDCTEERSFFDIAKGIFLLQQRCLGYIPVTDLSPVNPCFLCAPYESRGEKKIVRTVENKPNIARKPILPPERHHHHSKTDRRGRNQTLTTSALIAAVHPSQVNKSVNRYVSQCNNSARPSSEVKRER